MPSESETSLSTPSAMHGYAALEGQVLIISTFKLFSLTFIDFNFSIKVFN